MTRYQRPQGEIKGGGGEGESRQRLEEQGRSRYGSGMREGRRVTQWGQSYGGPHKTSDNSKEQCSTRF